MKIRDLSDIDTDLIEQIADFLFQCFRKYSPEWFPDLTASKEEIEESFLTGRRSRVLLDDGGRALGWIGAITDENLWEIHPIAVAPIAQRKGYGRILVDDVCELARSEGAVAIWASANDETNATSFSQMDLYKEASSALTSFAAEADHPVQFWVKMGFSLVGVLPDEEGLGKPGIHFSKRL